MGRFGETLAARFLESHGITVLDRNLRSGRGEIDVLGVDRHDAVVAFEVKTIVSEDAGADPLASADSVKLAAVRRAAAALTPPVWRVDVVGVVLGEEGATFRWLRDADW
ncbi:MAG: YraN family protein [Acidimicrobiia bacterium]